MSTLTIKMRDELEEKLRKEAVRRLGAKKGYLGEAIEDAVSLWLKHDEQEEMRNRLREIMNKGFYMGEKLYKSREDLWKRR